MRGGAIHERNRAAKTPLLFHRPSARKAENPGGSASLVAGGGNQERLKLICALPHPGFGLHWGGGWTERFQKVLAAADLVRTICPDFSYAAYQTRNEWMVRHSALVIAVFNGERGGTKNTMDYAQRTGVPCVVIGEEKWRL